MRTVAVLGGGIGGLAACYYLCKSPQVTKVVLVEASSRLGGWLWTTRRPDGAVFEHGPRGIRPAGAPGRNTLNMVEDLGLGAELLPVSSSHAASRNRFLYVGGTLHRMPSGLGGLLRTVPPFSRPLLFSVATEILVRRGQAEDESVHSFVSRRLGAELADVAVDSLCRGVFAGDCRTLSVRSCFPVLHDAERRRGSLTLGLLLGAGPAPPVPAGPLARRAARESWAQWSLTAGVQALPEAVADFLRRSGRVEVRSGAAVTSIHPSGSGWQVQLEDGVLSADHVMSALPAKALSAVLPPSCRPLVRLLRGVAAATVAVVNLEYDGAVLPVTGFGHLVPSWEDPALLGVVYDSVPFPEHDRPGPASTRLTVMMGGAWFQEVFGAPGGVSTDALLARAAAAVRAHLGVTAPPTWSRVHLHQDCIPQYRLGHADRVEAMRHFVEDSHLPLSLIGSSFDGVSVNDVIFSGRRAVDALVGL